MPQKQASSQLLDMNSFWESNPAERRAGERRQCRSRVEAYSVVGLNEGVVDGNDLDIGVLGSVAEDDTANAAKTVDADLDDHFD